jgi:hypothetical protein
MEFQEYPKALYLAGQQLVVEDSEQEEAARADGYDDWHADHARITGEPEAKTGEQADDEAPLDRDALKARAAELGVEFPKNIGTEKLAELVAAAEKA